MRSSKTNLVTEYILHVNEKKVQEYTAPHRANKFSDTLTVRVDQLACDMGVVALTPEGISLR